MPILSLPLQVVGQIIPPLQQPRAHREWANNHPQKAQMDLNRDGKEVLSHRIEFVPLDK